jgi:uncharacterized protein YacL
MSKVYAARSSIEEIIAGIVATTVGLLTAVIVAAFTHAGSSFDSMIPAILAGAVFAATTGVLTYRKMTNLMRQGRENRGEAEPDSTVNHV